jgi:type I restriction enzyme S subunit
MVRQPLYLKTDGVPSLPDGWRYTTTAEATAQLRPGKLFDSRSAEPNGGIPIIDQSSDGYFGWHDETPGVLASADHPVVTFANHTCAIRIMHRPFSCIQNIFPKVGIPSVCDTTYFYYAAQGRVDITDYKGHHPIFRSALIPLPPLPTQRRIAQILRSHDELIDVNRRRIAVLEDMARQLFDEWFVRYRFPGRDARAIPAGTDAPSPDGWRHDTLSAIAETIGEVVSPKETPDEVFMHYSFAAYDECQLPTAERGSEIRSGKIEFSSPAVLIGKLNPRIPRVWFVPVATGKRMIASTEFLILRPKARCSLALLFAYAQSQSVNARMRGLAHGTSTSHQRARQDDVIAIAVPIPPPALMETADRQLQPVYGAILNLRRSNRVLVGARDLLLPRLISGQLSVSAAERELEGVA